MAKGRSGFPQCVLFALIYSVSLVERNVWAWVLWRHTEILILKSYSCPIQYLGMLTLKQLVLYLKCKFDWESCVFSGSLRLNTFSPGLVKADRNRSVLAC